MAAGTLIQGPSVSNGRGKRCLRCSIVWIGSCLVGVNVESCPDVFFSVEFDKKIISEKARFDFTLSLRWFLLSPSLVSDVDGWFGGQVVGEEVLPLLKIPKLKLRNYFEMSALRLVFEDDTYGQSALGHINSMELFIHGMPSRSVPFALGFERA